MGQSASDSNSPRGFATPSESIRTYHDRRGRMGPQAHADMRRLLPKYSLRPTGAILDFVTVFGNRNHVLVELGFGLGEATIAMAKAEPHRNVCAVEVHLPGVARLLQACESENLTNVRVVHGDGVTLLNQRVPSTSLAEIRAFFPDPWPKGRHQKRRLFRPDLVALMRQKLMVGGVIHAATDWHDYAEQMSHVLSAQPGLANLHTGFAPRPASRPTTRFERKGIEKGHQVWDLRFARTS